MEAHYAAVDGHLRLNRLPLLSTTTVAAVCHNIAAVEILLCTAGRISRIFHVSSSFAAASELSNCRRGRRSWKDGPRRTYDSSSSAFWKKVNLYDSILYPQSYPFFCLTAARLSPGMRGTSLSAQKSVARENVVWKHDKTLWKSEQTKSLAWKLPSGTDTLETRYL